MVSCSGEIIACLLRMTSQFTRIMVSVLVTGLLTFFICVHGLHSKSIVLRITGPSIFVLIFVYLYSTCRGFSW